MSPFIWALETASGSMEKADAWTPRPPADRAGGVDVGILVGVLAHQSLVTVHQTLDGFVDVGGLARSMSLFRR